MKPVPAGGGTTIAYLASFFLLVPLIASIPTAQASDTSKLEQELSRIFVGRSFTIRNFYRGSHLQFGRDGLLAGRGEPGYWSRDGMVKIASVKVTSEDQLVFQGERYCVLFDKETGEFLNVRTGDKIELSVQIPSAGRTTDAIIPVLYKVFLTGKDSLPDLVPPYWRDCLHQKMNRRDKHSLWECVAHDPQNEPDFGGKKLVWDVPPPDTTLHTGDIKYSLRHKIAYLTEDGARPPRVVLASDPIFQWEQRRTKLDDITLVLAIAISDNGTVQDVSIVTPVGMGLDDDAARSVEQWKFSPALCGDKPCSSHARVMFEINAPNTRPTLR